MSGSATIKRNNSSMRKLLAAKCYNRQEISWRIWIFRYCKIPNLVAQMIACVGAADNP
jgi:hypothetical protein